MINYLLTIVYSHQLLLVGQWKEKREKAITQLTAAAMMTRIALIDMRYTRILCVCVHLYSRDVRAIDRKIRGMMSLCYITTQHTHMHSVNT